MTATFERRKGGGGLLLILGAVLFLLWLASVGAGMEAGLVTSPHAAVKHGAPAIEAVRYLRRGGPYNEDKCRDGKKMWTFRMNGEQWVAIVKGTTIVTAFPTTQSYIQRVKKRDGCGNGLQLGSQ